MCDLGLVDYHLWAFVSNAKQRKPAELLVQAKQTWFSARASREAWLLSSECSSVFILYMRIPVNLWNISLGWECLHFIDKDAGPKEVKSLIYFYILTKQQWGLSEFKDDVLQFSSATSRVWLFVTARTAACQASLSITNSWSLPKLMFIELVMPSNHLILCRPLLLLPSIFPSIRVFSNESYCLVKSNFTFYLSSASLEC